MELPDKLYHLVPEIILKKYLDIDGNYDCRNKNDWGNNTPFIHTTTTKKNLKNKIADPNWSYYPNKKKFLLLEIYPNKIKDKFTYSKFGKDKYYHIWGKLSKNSFKIIKVKRDLDGKFLI